MTADSGSELSFAVLQTERDLFLFCDQIFEKFLKKPPKKPTGHGNVARITLSTSFGVVAASSSSTLRSMWACGIPTTNIF